MNATNVASLPDGPAPEPAAESMLYQALAGSWQGADRADDLRPRFLAFVEKALREAKLRTRWTEVDEAYEAAVAAYAAALLSSENEEFLADFGATLEPYRSAGALNSVTQTLLKLAAPGIPDIYNGSEGIDLSLVDPDNRRPLDFTALERMLDGSPSTALDGELGDGRFKQRLVAAGLAARRRAPQLFARGDYLPLRTRGPAAAHVVAFMRRHGDRTAMAIAPLHPLALLRPGERAIAPEAWGDTAIAVPDHRAGKIVRDAMTGERLTLSRSMPVAQLLAAAPVRLLVND